MVTLGLGYTTLQRDPQNSVAEKDKRLFRSHVIVQGECSRSLRHPGSFHSGFLPSPMVFLICTVEAGLQAAPALGKGQDLGGARR